MANSSTKKRRRSAAEIGHPSVIALMKDAIADERPESVIRRKCRDMVAYAKSHGWSGPPYCPKILASLYNIAVEEFSGPMDGEGRILPIRGKTVIQYRSGVLAERQRFTLFHELAHTCFPDVFDFVRNRNGESEEEKMHRQFERLCDIGAGELLMPLQDFEDRSANRSLDAVTLRDLSGVFGSSPDATAKRFVDITLEQCGVAFLTDEAFSEFRSWEGRLRVKWYWPSSTVRGFIPTGVLVPANSVCNQCLTSGCDTSVSRETWYIADRPRSLYVEAISLPGVAGYPKVMAIIHFRKRLSL